MASPVKLSRTASSINVSGSLAPSRKLKSLWQCNSAYGTNGSSGRSSTAAGVYAGRLREKPGALSSSACSRLGGRRFSGRPDILRSSSDQETRGLCQFIDQPHRDDWCSLRSPKDIGGARGGRPPRLLTKLFYS